MTSNGNDRSLGSALVTLAALVAVLAGIRAAAEIVVPFLLILFIAILCAPAAEWLTAKGLGRGAMVTVVLAVFVLVELIMVAALGGAYQRFSASLPFYQQRITTLTESASDLLARSGIQLSVSNLADSLDFSVVMVAVRDLVLSLGGILTNSFLILLAVIFLLLEAPGLRFEKDSAPAKKEYG